MFYRVRRGDSSQHARFPLEDSPAAGLFRRERGVPLPRAGVRGAVVRPGGAARRRVAADRQRGRRVRGVAPAVALAAPGRPRHRAACCGARGRARRNEQLLLRGDRSAAARHGVRDRVPAGDRAGGDGRPLIAQRAGAGARGRRRVRARLRSARRRAARCGVRVRQRGAVRAVHSASAPGVARPADSGNRWARRRDAGRGAREHRDRRLGRRPAPARTGGDRRGHRRRHHLLGDPVRVRPARDDPAQPLDLLVDGVAASRDRDRDRDRRAGADPECAPGVRCRSGDPGGRVASRPRQRPR